MSDAKQDEFEQRAQGVLQESAEQLDGATRSRLTQARHAAVEVLKERRRKPWLWLMPAAGAAAAAVLTVALLVNPTRNQVEQQTLEPVDEFEIIAGEDELEFYRDVDFYAWLDTVLDEEIAKENGV